MIIKGTTALFLRHSHYLCMAADSRVAAIGAGTVQPVGFTNKIIIKDTFAYMKAGLLWSIKDSFSIDSIIGKAADKFSSLEDIASDATDQILNRLPTILNGLKDINMDYYNTYLHNKNQVICLAFMGLVNSDLKFYTTCFGVGDNGVSKNEIFCSTDLGLLQFGMHSEIDKYLDANPNPLKQGFRHGLNFLIELEAKANPGMVGPPVDILLLSKNGFEWL